MYINSINNSRGFTLIEVMIALTVLAFGILAVVGLFTNSIMGNTMGRRMTEATSLGQSRLDELTTSVPYNNLEGEAGPENMINAKREPGGFYNMSTSFEHLTSLEGAAVDMYIIDVRVRWKGRDKMHKVNFQTLRANDL